MQEAIVYVLETHPEILAASANKQAIEFELDQARSFFAPRFEFEAWGGSSFNDGTTTSDLTASDDPVTGYELTARMSQLLYDGQATRSEVNRQAYRVDAAALRVLERAEVLSLEAIRLYSDINRTERLLVHARDNLTYIDEVVRRVGDGVEQGVLLDSDLAQAQERLAFARDMVLEFEYQVEATRNEFLQVVGVDAGQVSIVPSIGGRAPNSLDNALAVARRDNPSIKFFRADVGAAEAQSARVNANQLPRVYLEADALYGEDTGGFVGDRRDARVGVVLRYDLQGNSKRAARQEMARRVNEARSGLLQQTRIVEREVRQSWTALQSAKRRLKTASEQSRLALEVRELYQQEYQVGVRSLLDILNTQNSYFQAQVTATNARVVEVFAEYRVLAAAGTLLSTLNIEPPEDSKVYARDTIGAPELQGEGNATQLDAGSFRDWRKSLTGNN